MKKFIYAVAIAVLILMAQGVYDTVSASLADKTEEEDALTVVSEVFQKEAIESLDCDIEAFCFYDVCYLSEDDKAGVLGTLAGELGIDSVYDYEERRTEQGAEAVLTKQGVNSKVCLKLITYEIPERENVVSLRQYISVNMTVKNSITSGLYYKEKLEEILKKITSGENGGELYEGDNIISISIKGNMSGKLDLENQEKIAGKILEELEAKTVFQYKPMEGEMDTEYSVYGYTEDLEEYLAIGNNRINVNVVYSYDEEQNVTTLHVASPVANYDY